MAKVATASMPLPTGVGGLEPKKNLSAGLEVGKQPRAVLDCDVDVSEEPVLQGAQKWVRIRQVDGVGSGGVKNCIHGLN